MISDRWDDVFALFDAALATSGEARERFLERECGSHGRLRQKVDSLIAAHGEAGGFLSGFQLRRREGEADPGAPDSRLLAPGTRIGVFEIEDFVGAGGMGEVYRARDTRLDRHVAIKLLSPDAATDSRSRARFIYEARAIARLSHPHICGLHDLGHHEGLDFLVMEYLKGETLASRLRRGPLTVAEAVRTGVEVAEALDAAHAEGIVHRDLKPANIMLVNGGASADSPPKSKLLDFGLAQMQAVPQISDAAGHSADSARSTARGVIAGTPRYMAPEQVRGEEADPRSDMFSFGSVLYEMVTGRPPFAGETADELMAAIVDAQPTGLPISTLRSGGASENAARRLDTVIRRCLEKAPDRRFGRMSEVRTELRDNARTTMTVRGPRTRGRLIAVAATIAATAIAAAGALGLRSRWSAVATSAPMRVAQLTALNGLEVSPTFSPDGTQVAFSWNGEREDNYDIYVMRIGSPDVQRLTTDPAADTLPVWSPDGQEIAFLRDHPQSEGTIVHAIRPTGDGERRLTDFRIGGGTSARIAWSPDQRAIVGRPDLVEDVARNGSWALYLIPIGSGTPRRLTEARGPDIDTSPAFSPDGRRLAYAACVNLTRRLCAVNVLELRADFTPAAAPRRLTIAGQQIRSIAWSHDGRSIVYDSNPRGIWALWKISLDGSAEPEKLEMPGDHSRQPAIAPTANRLAFERGSQLMSVFKLRSDAEPEPVLVSTAWDYNPQFSPDGRRIAFSSRRFGGVEEIWLASADGSGARRLTHGPGARQTLPAWSPDGRQIAFESSAAGARSDIWVIPADGGSARRLTTDAGEENAPVWSRDGTRIYFLSDRGGDGFWGGHDTWQVPAQGGPATRVTQGGSNPVVFESADGTELIYQSRIEYQSAERRPVSFQTMGDSPLLAVPIGGGRPRQIVDCVKSQAFAVTATGVYYSPCGSRRERNQANGFLQTWLPGSRIPIQVLDPSDGRVRVLGSVKAPFEPTRLAVSPDGHTILVHRNTSISDLMLIENFR